VSTTRANRLCLLAAPLLLCACTHSTWPPLEEGSRQSSTANINNAPIPAVIGDALSVVTLRYPPVANAERGKVYDAPFAVSLPAGADAAAYDHVVSRVRQGGRGAEPATEENASLPTYYVTRIIVRAVTAEVDVVRPVPDLGTSPDGAARYQGVTVYLSGSLGSWKVESHHSFPVGLADAPTRNTRPVGAPTWGAQSE